MMTAAATPVRPLRRYAMPEKTRGRPLKYPWKTMQVGESFHMANIKISNACSQYAAFAKELGRKFTARSTGPGTSYPKEPRGVMVWRIE